MAQKKEANLQPMDEDDFPLWLEQVDTKILEGLKPGDKIELHVKGTVDRISFASDNRNSLSLLNTKVSRMDKDNAFGELADD